MVWVVADDHVMVLLTFGLVFADLGLIQDLSMTILIFFVVERYLVHAPKTSPMIVPRGEVLSSLLSVSDWSLMGGDGRGQSYDGFQWSA